MSTFEFAFGLISLLLGLGFVHVAQAFAKLIMAGPRVRWDWLSPLAAVTMFQLGLVYWWAQYGLRNEELVLGAVVVQACACLALYMMAVAALPEPESGESIDLRRHFERSRRLFYACQLIYAFIVVALPQIAALTAGRPLPHAFSLLEPALFAALIVALFWRNRWFHSLLLTAIIGNGAWGWLFAGLQ